MIKYIKVSLLPKFQISPNHTIVESVNGSRICSCGFVNHTIVEFVNGSRICSCGFVRGTPPNLREENVQDF